MTDLDINRQIRQELRVAFHKVGGGMLRLEQIGIDHRNSDRIATEFAKHKAPFDLLCIVGSWGDTLSAGDVLHGLELFNKNGITYSRIMCAVELDAAPAKS